jgi:hypothetical protein
MVLYMELTENLYTDFALGPACQLPSQQHSKVQGMPEPQVYE